MSPPTVDACAKHRDLTERVLLTALRQEARADVAEGACALAERASAARAQSLRETSHELRTPLNIISGYVELMESELRGPLTSQQRDALSRIRVAVRHMSAITTAFGDQARRGAGRSTYDFRDVSVLVAMHDAIALVELQASLKPLSVAVVPCDPHLAVRADSVKLRQVLVNLLWNAVKFTDAGGAIEVRCAALDDPQQLAISVADSGRGIAPDQVARVFEPYVQAGRHLSGEDAGLGLGLAISRAILRDMGGELAVESVLGIGSTFTLTLPSATRLAGSA